MTKISPHALKKSSVIVLRVGSRRSVRFSRSESDACRGRAAPPSREPQAERYICGLFARLDAIAARQFPWRPVPADFGVEGFVCRYERHLIYWKVLADGDIGGVTVLHERMHQIEWFRDDLELR